MTLFDTILKDLDKFIYRCGFTDDLKAVPTRRQVLYCYFLLSSSRLFPGHKSSQKSTAKAAQARADGNKAFVQRNDYEALRLYTRAVASAPDGSPEMALALANRSAVTHSLNECRDSIKDIDRALVGRYPEHLKYKLLERKAKCLIALDLHHQAAPLLKDLLELIPRSGLPQDKVAAMESSVQSLHQSLNLSSGCVMTPEGIPKESSVPTLSLPPSPYIQSASIAVDIEHTPCMGRYVVAATDILPGDVVAVEKPYSAVLLPSSYDSFCYKCHRRCHSLLPCLQCSLVRKNNTSSQGPGERTDDSCRSSSWKEGHRIDCGILSTLISFGCDKIELLALSMLMKATKGGTRLQQFIESLNWNGPTSRTTGFVQGSYLSDEYTSTHWLESNEEKRSYADMFQRAVRAACILHSLTSTKFFDSVKEGIYEGDPETVIPIDELELGGKSIEIGMMDYGVSEAHGAVGSAILRYLCSVPCNAHEVAEMRIRGKDIQSLESAEIGSAIYPFLSLINHSCDPNVVRHAYNGDTVVLTAIQPIIKGQQIFDNYGFHWAVHDRSARQNHLESQYYFKCDCPPCQEDWPRHQDLPDSQNTDESSKFSKVLEDVMNGSTDGHLHFLCSHLKTLHEKVRRPNKEYNMCQEAIKQCLSVQANHYVFNK